MTLYEIIKRLQVIKTAGDDSEVAHELEDELYVDVLTDIASGGKQHERKAALVLESQDYSHSRWYA